MSQTESILAPAAPLPRLPPDVLARPASWRSHADLAGRLVLGGVTAATGLLGLVDWDGLVTRVTAVGMPGLAPVAAAVGVVQALAGLALVLGWRTRFAAALLAGLTALGAPVFDRFWSAPGPFGEILLGAFLAKLALAGALVCLAGRGPGRWSLDALRRD